MENLRNILEQLRAIKQSQGIPCGPVGRFIKDLMNNRDIITFSNQTSIPIEKINQWLYNLDFTISSDEAESLSRDSSCDSLQILNFFKTSKTNLERHTYKAMDSLISDSK